MRKQPIWMLPVALFAALSLLLAACGDDDESASGDDQSAETDGTDQPADDGGSDNTAGGTEDTTGDTGDDTGTVDFSGDCAFLGEFASGLEDFDPSTLFSGRDVGEAMSNLGDQFDEVAENAPEEIRDAFRTIADGMREFTETMGDIDLSDPSNIDPEDLEQLEGLQNGFGPEFEEASAEVDAWIQENCPQG